MSQLWPRFPVQSAGRVTQAASLEGGSKASKKVAVVAFGGNALLSRGEPLTMDAQWQNATKAGNGPQVGLLAVQDPATGLDVLDAESEGQIGYILETQLANTLPGQEVVTLLTQTVVDPADPAFKHPTKPIGATYDKQEAERLAREKGWAIAADGNKWRRVVASPDPQAILEARAIQLLLANKVVPICCGGGGIPVAVDKERHRRYGVEAVVDKDLASAVLAIKIKADWLLMLTDCDCIFDPEQWPDRKVPLPSPISPQQLRTHTFAAGSMAPKVEAACRFVAATGGRAGVGRLEDAAAILQGSKGTVVAPPPPGLAAPGR
ncbi:hypothetical protein N2152v2_007512 [Parachlorella kessleri]